MDPAAPRDPPDTSLVRAGPRTARTIRSRLVLLVLVVLIPAAMLAVTGHGYVYRGERRGLERSLGETTRALALLVDREIARREAMLTTLAASPVLDRPSSDEFWLRTRGVAAPGDVFVVTDVSGRAATDPTVPWPDHLPVDLFSQESPPDERDTLLSHVFPGPMPGTATYAMRRPIVRDSIVMGYLTLISSVDDIQRALNEQQLPSEWTGAVIDPGGTIVARNRRPEIHVGQPANRDVVERAATAASGFFESVTRDGVATFAYFSKAPTSGWIFIIGVPQAEVGRRAAGALAAVGSGSLLLLGLAVFLAVRVGRQIEQPVRAMADAARELGRGAPVPPRATGLQEMDTVQLALAQASEQIRNSKAEMERRITEAVAESQRSQQALLQAQKLEALGRLTGGIAHDFNNLLQTLSTGLQFAHSTSSHGEVRHALESCLRALTRGTRLTRQLMAFGRNQVSESRAIDLRTQLLAMEDLLKSALRHDLVLRLEVTKDLWAVRVDPVQFEMALLNLVFNARDAMPAAGELKVEARNRSVRAREVSGVKPGDYVQLGVHDTGEGMSAEVRAKALEPFFTTKPAGKGSGLGLSQVYGFVQQSEGGISLESEPGRGTSVVLLLPRTAELPISPGGAWSDPGGSVVNVLVVEDDVLVRDVVGPALAGFNFEVTIAAGADEALDQLERRADIDVVFSDIVMPGSRNGLELAAEIRRRFPDLPVVLATGYSERATASRAQWRTIAKPYDVAVVAAELRAAVQEAVSPG
jgi:signal transduction histidine kinase